jgi:hypothetical protein
MLAQEGFPKVKVGKVFKVYRDGPEAVAGKRIAASVYKWEEKYIKIAPKVLTAGGVPSKI